MSTNADLKTYADAPSGRFTTTYLRCVRYGPDSVKDLYDTITEILPKGIEAKAIIVTGKSLSKTSIIPSIEDQLKSHNAYVDTFTSIRQHTPSEDVDKLLQLVRQKGATIAVAVGGGSPIDACKALSSYHKDKYGEFLPHIAIPTTLSAAEFTHIAGHTNKDGQKETINNERICPNAVIMDPVIAMQTPRRLWLSTGIRALDHAIEGLYRPGAQYPNQQLGLSAIRDLFTYLPRCAKDETDTVEARGKLQLAAWMSLFPARLDTALGPSHILGHGLGSRYSIPHGICSVLTLPNTVRAMARSLPAGPERIMLANAFSYLPTPFVRDHIGFDDDEHSEVNAALVLASALDKLIERLDLHSTLSEYKVPKEDLKTLAGKAHEACVSKPGWAKLCPSAETLEKQVLEKSY